MTLHEAHETLSLHQKWRRGEIEENPHTPKEIGQAIDVVLRFVGGEFPENPTLFDSEPKVHNFF